MKLLISGSRSIKSFDLSEHIPKDTEFIITGGASGIDQLAELYADSNKISKIVIRPKYHLYGKAAPLKRNEMMVDIADTVLVVWDGRSKGSRHTIDYAVKKNKKLIVIKIGDGP